MTIFLTNKKWWSFRKNLTISDTSRRRPLQIKRTTNFVLVPWVFFLCQRHIIKIYHCYSFAYAISSNDIIIAKKLSHFNKIHRCKFTNSGCLPILNLYSIMISDFNWKKVFHNRWFRLKKRLTSQKKKVWFGLNHKGRTSSWWSERRTGIQLYSH